MYTFYYQVKKESLYDRIYRKYGWIVWLALACLIFYDYESNRKDYYFRIVVYLLLALLNFPWKKYIKPYIQLDEEGIATVLPHGQETTKLLWKEVKKVFYSTNGGLCFYHGSDFTFYIALSSLSEEDKKSVIDIVKQKLDSSVMGLDKL